MDTVIVFGATGHTGAFVVAELIRRGLQPIAVGRTEAKLRTFEERGIETRIVDFHDAVTVDRALAGSGAVINAAGPFLDTAPVIVERAVRMGLHYLDVTAEQQSALSTFERFNGPAHRRGVAVLPAVAFYGGLGDLVASAALHDSRSADELDVFVVLDRWWPTEGTRRTGERNTAPRLVFNRGKFAPLKQPAQTIHRDFGEAFGPQALVELPFTETILLARHLPVRNIRHFVSQRAIDDVRDPTTPAPEAADASGRSKQRFLVEAVARTDNDERRAMVRGRDIYAITAPIVVEATLRVLGGNVGSGCFALAQLFDPESFLLALPLESVSFPNETFPKAQR